MSVTQSLTLIQLEINILYYTIISMFMNSTYQITNSKTYYYYLQHKYKYTYIIIMKYLYYYINTGRLYSESFYVCNSSLLRNLNLAHP